MVQCEWCQERVEKKKFEEHAQLEHPNLYRKYIAKQSPIEANIEQ